MIRRISQSDIERIYQLGEEYNSNFRNEYNLDFYLNNKSFEVLCFEANNNILGFIIITIIDTSKEILLLYVDENHRREHIGSLLLEYIENNASDILLEVSIENEPAIKLYEKAGYKKISIRKGYYKGIDALVMKKVIS